MEKTTLEEAQEALKEILKNTERIGTYAKNEQKKKRRGNRYDSFGELR